MFAERTAWLLNVLQGRQETGQGVVTQTLPQEIRKHVGQR